MKCLGIQHFIRVFLLSLKHYSVYEVHLNLVVVSCLQVSRMKRIKIVYNHCNTFVILKSYVGKLYAYFNI